LCFFSIPMPEEKRLLRIPRHGWEDNTKVDQEVV